MNRITNSLWIGDIDDVRQKDTNRFDRVVTVCQDNVEDNVGCAYDYFNVADGDAQGHVPGDPSYKTFAGAVDRLVTSIEDGEVVLCHCHAGLSRSVMACTAALAVTEGLDFDRAFWKVRAARGGAQPSNGVRLHAQRYIRENT